MAQLIIDQALVNKARGAAQNIARQVRQAVDGMTTVSIERASLRLLGIDGVDAQGAPLVNIVMEHLLAQDLLGQGAVMPVVAAMERQGTSAQEVASAVACGALVLTKTDGNREAIKNKALQLAGEACRKISANRRQREEMIQRLGKGPAPQLYLIVATGNIYEDIKQA